jgi:cell division protease FtsH
LNPFYKNLALWVVILMMMVMLYRMFNAQETLETTLGYSEFLTLVDDNRIEEVLIQGQDLSATEIGGRRYRVYAPQDPELVNHLRQSNVRITAKPAADSPWYNILISWLPMLVLIGVWIFFMRQMQAGGGKAMSFGKSRARLMPENQEKVTFEDVAGIDEAKEELSEVVDFCATPKNSPVLAAHSQRCFAHGASGHRQNASGTRHLPVKQACLLQYQRIRFCGNVRGSGCIPRPRPVSAGQKERALYHLH